MADYEYTSDLDISAIKKKLDSNAKDFDKYAKQAETALDRIQKKAEQTANKLKQQQAKQAKALETVGKLGGGKFEVKRLSQDTIDLQNALKTLGKTGEFEIKKLGDAGDKAGGKFQALAGKIGGVIGVLGALGTAAAVGKQLVDTAIENEKAQFALAASAGAANREFGDSAGTLDSWKKTVSDTSKEVKIFSEREVAGASARLIDMTKRLGLTEQQMQEVLKRSADLSAGKDSLEGGVERVTAALRGEAESAEALGLSLSETAVMQYAEAHGLVFKELTEGEKVQLRYALLLEQTNQIQGRAAAFAETLAGKQAAVTAQLENSNAVIGEQLFPLYEGWAALVGLVAQENEEGIGLVTSLLAGLAAALVTVGAGYASMAATASGAYNVIAAGAEAVRNLENPFEAVSAAIEENQGQLNAYANFATGVPGIFSSAFDQIVEGWEGQRDAAESAAAGIGPAVGDIQSGIEGLVAAQDEAAVSAEDYAEAQDKIQEAHDKFNTEAARDELDLLIKAERAALDAALDAARKREDLARKNLQRISDIQAESEQAFADAATDANREEEDQGRESARRSADIERSAAQRQADIARQAAQKRLDIETDYRRKLEDIRTQFERSAVEAERSRDAIAFLRARDERDQAIQDAGTERNRGLQDVGTQEGRDREQAAQDAEREREEARINDEREREDARIAEERKLEDLRLALERKLEEQRLANERELEEARLAEERKAEDLALANEQAAEDLKTAQERKKEDLAKSLEEETALVKKYEAQKTATFKTESERRIAQARKEADEMRRLSQQSASGTQATGNPLTGGPTRRAAGGPVAPGADYLVGERGPEIFSPNTPGRITPNRAASPVPAPANLSRVVDNSIRNSNEFQLSDPSQLSPTQRAMIQNMITEAQAAANRGRRAGVR